MLPTFLATVTIAADTDTLRDVGAAAPGNFVVTLFDGSGTTVIDTRTGTELTYTFAGLPASSYVVSARLNDTDGVLIGSTALASFTAAGDTTTVKSVSGVSVVVTVQ